MTPTEVARLALAELGDPEKAVVAVAIAKAESNLNPSAVGDKRLVSETWGPSIGLWQIRSLHTHRGTGKERDATRLHDPAFNARAMRIISSNGTYWRPWSVWLHGTYEKHLPEARLAVTDVLPVEKRLVPTSKLREWWAPYRCKMGGEWADPLFFGQPIGGVPAVAVEAFRALEDALRRSGYQPESRWAYNCRPIAGTTAWSLHAYGIAIDIDPAANPFSTGDPFAGRLKPHHVEAVEALRSKGGRQLWAWGGRWTGRKDRMHFQLNVPPDDCAPLDLPDTEEEVVLTASPTKRNAVVLLQSRLNAWAQYWTRGGIPPLVTDGVFGAKTEEYVRHFQHAMGLPVTGQADATTLSLLSFYGGAV